MDDRQTLRQQLRRKRQQLNLAEQATAATQLAANLAKQPIFQASQHIGSYIANDGELNPAPLFEQNWQHPKKCYLPVLNSEQQLCFVAYQSGDPLQPNRYKIPEPELSADKLINITELDLVLLPLVGFDLQGNRLGMGAGYYDRTFAFLRDCQRPAKPYLLGIAYEIQKTTCITHQPWDVRLDGIMTETNFYEITVADEI